MQSSELEEAILTLKQHGREIEPSERSLTEGIAIPVDGIPRTPDEILDMARQLRQTAE